MTMDPSHPTSATAQAQAEAAAGPSSSAAPVLKTKADQIAYLLRASQRIERSLANLAKNQESLERVIETKLHALDVKVTEIATTVDQLKSDVENARSND